MGQWRAGRAVRVTAALREPTTYRNPGVPDERRALARRGIALVGIGQECGDGGGRRRPGRVWRSGSRRSARGSRSVLDADRRSVERPIGGRRRRDRDRGSHGPRPRTTSGACRRLAPITSSRSRVGTSRSSPCCCSVPAGGSARRHVSRRRGDCRASFLRSDHRVGAVGGSRDLGGGRCSWSDGCSSSVVRRSISWPSRRRSV